MNAVSTREGCQDYVPSVRTECHHCSADCDRDNPGRTAQRRLHQPLAHTPLVLAQKEATQFSVDSGNRRGGDRQASQDLRPTVDVHLERTCERAHRVRDGESGGHERKDDRTQYGALLEQRTSRCSERLEATR